MLNPNGKVSKKRKTSITNGSENKPIDPVAKKLKLKKDLHKVAKVEEINQLIATEKLYHSNFFHLQTEELLKATKLTEKRANFIETFSSQLIEFLKAIPSEENETPVHELKWLKKNKIVPPISDELPFDSTPIKFRFLSPLSVFAAGALRSKTIINADPMLDMCVDIPNEFFSKGNHLNGIYYRKKSLYLSYLAMKLHKWDQVTECKFSYALGNPFQPILVLRPTGKYGKHITFSLRAVCSEESFKIERLSPDKSNVKQLKNVNKSLMNVVKNVEHSATPHYNSIILGDLNTKFNETFLNNAIGDNQHIRDAILLLKIWLKQREYNVGQSGFNGFIISMFVVYLIQKNLITPSMNSYQIIRQVWIHLANTSWDELNKSISLYESKFRTTQPDPEMFHQYFDVVFIDSTGYYNICSNLSLDVYRRVKSDSALALKLLNNEQVNSFRCLFGTKIPLYTQVDHIIRVDASNLFEKFTNADDLFDFAGYWYPYVEKFLFKVLRKGLEQRIHAILPISEAHAGIQHSWNINAQPNFKEKEFKFGLILNPEFALDILNKGPQSNLPEAEEYRQFWGSKSELRRFQDG